VRKFGSQLNPLSLTVREVFTLSHSRPPNSNIMKYGVRIQVLGNLKLLPPDVQEVMARVMYHSKDNTRSSSLLLLQQVQRFTLALTQGHAERMLFI